MCAHFNVVVLDIAFLQFVSTQGFWAVAERDNTREAREVRLTLFGKGRFGLSAFQQGLSQKDSSYKEGSALGYGRQRIQNRRIS